MSDAMQHAIDSAPEGTAGLVIAPWSEDEVYGVAANWAEASSPIRTYGPDGWEQSRYQVADFCHEPREAMGCELRQALVASGDDEGQADDLLDTATEF